MNIDRIKWAQILLIALICALPAKPVGAQEPITTYTVVAGDSLSAIATRFEVPVEQLAAYNGIDDPALIQVGMVLTIPSEADLTRLAAVNTVPVYALSGETLAGLANRTGLNLAQLVELNGIEADERLFPGQPVAVPSNEAPAEMLRFGAITGVDFTDPVIQGRTGQVIVTADRPVFLSAMFHDIPLVFAPVDDDSKQQFAHLPAPALLEPGTYPLTINYLAGRGMPVAKTWPVQIADGYYANQQIVLPDEKSELLNPALVEGEEAQVNAVMSQVSPAYHWAPEVARPISAEFPTTSPFGTRRNYVGGDYTGFGYHAGQDFAAPATVTTVAPATGTVALAETLPIRGNAVIVDHGSGVFTGYWHFSELFVEEGQTVNTGDPLGIVGTTGRSTGPHLHWELRIYGVAVDPMQFLTEVIDE